MSVPNFSFLACQEVAENFGVGHVATVSNLNPQPQTFLKNRDPPLGFQPKGGSRFFRNV